SGSPRTRGGRPGARYLSRKRASAQKLAAKPGAVNASAAALGRDHWHNACSGPGTMERWSWVCLLLFHTQLARARETAKLGDRVGPAGGTIRQFIGQHPFSTHLRRQVERVLDHRVDADVGESDGATGPVVGEAVESRFATQVRAYGLPVWPGDYAAITAS